MDEIHCPDLVGSCGGRTVLAQLSPDPAFWRFVAQLQAQLAVKPAHALGVDQPPFTPQQHLDAAIAITHASLGDLLDPLHRNSLPGALRPVVVGRAVDRHAWQARRMLTRHTVRTSSTSCRFRVGFIFCGGSRPAAFPCRVTDRQL